MWQKLRPTLLIALLVVELVLVVSLRTQGWVETNSSVVWTVSLLAAFVPLLMSGILLFRNGVRFTLRSLLVVMALVSIFLLVTVLPLLKASRARAPSRRLIALGAELHNEASWNGFYEKLGFDPRGPLERDLDIKQSLTPWLKNLAGKSLELPPGRDVRSVRLSSDAQIAEFCSSVSELPNVELVGVFSGGNLSDDGLEQLRQILPKLNKLTQLDLNSVIPSADWFGDLKNIRMLAIWAEGTSFRRISMSHEQLSAIAKLPDLKMLFLFGLKMNDSDLPPLRESKSLRHLFIRQTAVTDVGGALLQADLDDCEVHVD